MLQRQRQAHYSFADNITDLERTPIIWQIKEVWVLAWTNSIFGDEASKEGIKNDPPDDESIYRVGKVHQCH